jgi:uncharacterized protein YdhG (YjbR/CyaY superfamily)
VRKVASIEDYIAGYPPKVRGILRKIRAVARKAAPKATERIAWGMPTLVQDGMLIHYAAFKEHIGVFRPVRHDDALLAALKGYANEKGNLRFDYDKPIPYELIARVVKARAKENAAAQTRKTERRRARR